MNEREESHYISLYDRNIIIGIILVIIFSIWGYNRYQDNKFSKPWWRGKAYQQVCDWQGIKCYILPVTVSSGSQAVNMTFPNGGSVYGYMACHKRYGGGRFCDFFDQEGNQWDILPIN
jgi:hypothetical protein